MSTDISLQDYVAIANRMARYCHHIDDGDAPAWAGCFTEDGVFEGDGPPGRVEGRAALEAFARATYVSTGGRMRHMVGNLACAYGADGDQVKARFYNLVTTFAAGSTSTVMADCEALFVRQGDDWVLKRNAFRMLA
jgi:hypothetical protein